jgi:hypothetical protein
MTEPTTVWMVHARTTLDGVKGVLSLEDRALVFRPEGGRSAETVIPLSEIRKVGRAPGSPVLEVHPVVPGGPSVIGFYFVQPPSLATPTEGFRLFSRYLARRRAIVKLRGGNAMKRREVEAWVGAVGGALDIEPGTTEG